MYESSWKRWCNRRSKRCYPLRRLSAAVSLSGWHAVQLVHGLDDRNQMNANGTLKVCYSV